MSVNAIRSTLTAASGVEVDGANLVIDNNYLRYGYWILTQNVVLGMYAAPFSIIAAPTGTGQFLVLDKAILVGNNQSITTPFADGGNVYLQYGNTPAATNATVSDVTSAANLIDATSNNKVVTLDGIFPSTGVLTQWDSYLETGIYITNDTGAFTGGANSLIVLHYWYRILDFAS